MADEKNVEKQEDPKQEKTNEKTRSSGFLGWIIIVVVVVICAGAGFGLGRLFAGFHTPEVTESQQQEEAVPTEDLTVDVSETDSHKGWYYDLEPVVANLDEPGVRRYVRATLTMAISSQTDPKKGFAFLEEKKPLLTNWLTIYLASLALEDIRGDKNLKRIQLEIQDAFNERLFPDSKPQINKILFKEFAVQ
ncbi:MAG: flagellar basal body-associated FliL family protein [Planctomycetota bacterium]|jgi:flagellar basal body-associated protein FliL